MELSPHSLTACNSHAVFGVWLEGLRLLPALPFSALPPRASKQTLALKLFRGEPAITQFDWNFSPIHNSSQCVAQHPRSVLPNMLLLVQPGHGKLTGFRVSCMLPADFHLPACRLRDKQRLMKVSVAR